MAAAIVNPKPFLDGLIGKAVIVKLKWGMECVAAALPPRALPAARAAAPAARCVPLPPPPHLFRPQIQGLAAQRGQLHELPTR